MFNFFKTAYARIFQQVTTRVRALFQRGTIDEAALKELEQIFIQADTGTAATKRIIDTLKTAHQAGAIKNSDDLRRELVPLLAACLEDHKTLPAKTDVYLLVGVNGTGKTTLAAKLAYQEKNNGKKVLLVAGDTFRAAAQEQLALWAHRLSVDIVQGKTGGDPAAVVFCACQTYTGAAYDCMIVDTAGRLQTKTNLMKELAKIKRVINTQLPNAQVHTMLTIDAMLGQNSLEQARVFHESTQIDSLVLTKMDGTGKGGIVFALMHEFNIPVSYIAFGEKPEQLKAFESQTYLNNLLDLES